MNMKLGRVCAREYSWGRLAGARKLMFRHLNYVSPFAGLNSQTEINRRLGYVLYILLYIRTFNTTEWTRVRQEHLRIHILGQTSPVSAQAPSHSISLEQEWGRVGEPAQERLGESAVGVTITVFMISVPLVFTLLFHIGEWLISI